jgi:hypothetical protein
MGIFGGGGCGVNIGGSCGGGWCEWGHMVSSGWWACCLNSDAFGEGYHPQACAGALAGTDYGVAVVADGAVNFCRDYCASSVAHSDNGE